MSVLPATLATPSTVENASPMLAHPAALFVPRVSSYRLPFARHVQWTIVRSAPIQSTNARLVSREPTWRVLPHARLVLQSVRPV